MNPQNQTQEVNVNNPLSSMQVGERNIFEVKRHPFGMFVTYLSAGFLIVIAAVVAFIVVPMAAPTGDKSQLETFGALGFIVFGLLVLGFVFVANKVYWGNRWILTSDSLTQVTQRSLFDKQNSQLSLGNLEDVTASQDGILAHMFGFGILRVETAGERSKFVFPYCPKPNLYAQQILSAREQFEQKLKANEGGQMAPRGTNTNTAAEQIASYQVPTDDDLQK